MMTRKTIALTISTFPGKGISLLFYMLYSLIVFLPRSRQLLSSWVHVIIHSDFGAQEKKICHCFHFFYFYLPWDDGTGKHKKKRLFHNVEFQVIFFTLLFYPHQKTVPLLPLKWLHLHIWGCWNFSWQSWFQPMIHPA